MNQRPLGISSTGEEVNTICPDSLCFGYIRRTDRLTEPLFELSQDGVRCGGDDDPGIDLLIESAAVRQGGPGFLPGGALGTPPRRLSAWLKDRSTRNARGGSRGRAGVLSFAADELVFVKSGKSINPARVVKTLPGSDGVVRRLLVRNIKSGRESTVSHHNVAKSCIESDLQV
ncbi:hypothetical protein Pmar_PMAR027224 [Perkinsus marinus ATCC 50983]|uniref:Uncharacterized protein n=1 Tax=Perkinsus marinus (strain ATCC 50983 / TXsc) TaxID=423536 RepID=C5LWW2_PERM5|nr:hypothetical protein Pmar_PMAR027224 [Perkinsus marinus ATCC 50983]EEQ98740.1 hypothetical protein Pmar_PMAR027224 [Perkinsus marinus ATCC 50983]|eukprot:XP_002766023.1 hypothetical protein Pmar_PMAR027224 [Perkinsus marinus ATCC 50983]